MLALSAPSPPVFRCSAYVPPPLWTTQRPRRGSFPPFMSIEEGRRGERATADGRRRHDVDPDRLAFPELDRLFSNIEACEIPEDGFKRKPGSVLGATALLGGTTVGAGILGLPAVTAPSGFLPSTAALFGVWLYMAASGLLIAEVSVNVICRQGRPGLGLLRVAEEAVGPAGARAAGAVYIFIHYALLVAYMAQGGEILVSGGRSILSAAAVAAPGLGPAAVGAAAAASAAAAATPPWAGAAAFVAVFGGMFVALDSDAVERVNNGLVAVVLGSFVALLATGLPNVEVAALGRADWGAIGGALPVMFVALVYHNVIPVVVTQLEGDVDKIRTAIVAGSFVPLLMFLAWDAVVLGSVDAPAATAAATAAGAAAVAAATGAPVAAAAGPAAAAAPLADPLQLLRETSGAVGPLVSLFSEAAIVTSFVGFVVGLLDLYTDVFDVRLGDRARELPLYGLIMAPPLLVAATNPSIFLAALDTAGAFGISLLFGVLPAAMAWQQRYREDSVVATLPLVPGGRYTLAAMVAVAGAVIAEKAAALLQAAPTPH